MFSEVFKKIFDKVVDIVFGLILTFIIIGIAIGTMQLSVSIWKILQFEGVTGQYLSLITDILTLYVLVELSRSITDYFTSHKLRLSLIIDASIIFIIRELLIALFKHQIDAEMIYALSVLLFVLGALRTSAVIIYQQEKKLSHETNN